MYIFILYILFYLLLIVKWTTIFYPTFIFIQDKSFITVRVSFKVYFCELSLISINLLLFPVPQEKGWSKNIDEYSDEVLV